MTIDYRYPVNEELRTARWNASMDALEANWLERIAATQAEYQEVRMRLNGERPRPAIAASADTRRAKDGERCL